MLLSFSWLRTKRHEHLIQQLLQGSTHDLRVLFNTLRYLAHAGYPWQYSLRDLLL